MTALRWVRRSAALLLLVAMFLPLSRCSRQPGGAVARPGGGAVARPRDRSDGAAAPREYRYSYAWTDFDPRKAASWLIFLAFLWPIPFVAREIAPGRRCPAWLYAVQLLPAAGAILLVYYRTFLEELWVGGYLAFIALGFYAATLLVEVGSGLVRGTKKGGP